VDKDDEPDMIIANWWKDKMAKLDLPDGVPVVHWWTGSDTHRSTAHSYEERYNWVVAPWLARLLKRRVGIDTRVVPCASSLRPRLLPQSPTRRVLVYCPTKAERVYGWKQVVEVARACPEFEFAVLLHDGEPAADNMTYLPRVEHQDMPGVYESSRLLLRLTPSDGSSSSVVEALGFGRHAIWNWWLPGATHVGSASEAIEAIHRLIDAPPYAGGVASATEHRAQADFALSRAIEGTFS
jgi:hypothetical protein